MTSHTSRTLSILILVLFGSPLISRAQTDYTLAEGGYAVLFEGNGTGNTLNINNGPGPGNLAVMGNIGIGGVGQVALSGPLTIDGNFNFNGSVQCTNNCMSMGNITVNGTANADVTMVQTDLNNLRSPSL